MICLIGELLTDIVLCHQDFELHTNPEEYCGMVRQGEKMQVMGMIWRNYHPVKIHSGIQIFNKMCKRSGYDTKKVKKKNSPIRQG